MPFMVNALQILELRNVRIGRPAIACVVAILLGLAIALPVTLYIKYDMGSSTGDSWATVHVPKNPFDNAVMIRQKLEAQGLDAGEAPGAFLGRLGDTDPTGICVLAMVAGLILVLSFSAARLRFPWWPFHPLMFVTWASTPLRWMGPSYLLGWVIKTLIVRYGGSRAYDRLKPLMMGLIAGEVLGALFPTLVGAIYFFLTNQQPRTLNVLPG